jgi:predicted cobalt transporter CbtA
MAKQQQQQRQAPAPPQPRKTAPAPARRPAEKKDSIFSAGSQEFIFGRQNFIYMGIGLALVLIGLATMSGGAMPDPNKWEPERIYSFTRITLAPILMVAGFVMVAVGIFKRQPETPVYTNEPEA